MSEHIMHSDIVKKIKNNNWEKSNEIHDQVVSSISKVVDEIDKSEKGDQCLVIKRYCRSGNDIITSSSSFGVKHSSMSEYDYVMCEKALNGVDIADEEGDK